MRNGTSLSKTIRLQAKYFIDLRFFLYTVLIRLYGLAIALASLFNDKAKSWTQGRRHQFEKIQNDLKTLDFKKSILLHAASYGEFEMARPIINAIHQKAPETKFVISFYSPSGYEQVHFEDKRFYKIYLPLDTPKNQERLIEVINPIAAIFIKYDFWFNLLRVLKTKQIPYFFTSIHFNQDHYLLKSWAKPFGNLLKSAQQLFCHNSNSIEIFKKNGFQNLTLFGDSRVDQVLRNKDNPIRINCFSQPSKPIIAFGSITDKESMWVIDFMNGHQAYNYILAPHEVDQNTIQSFKNKIKLETSMYSSPCACQVCLVDSMGDLKYLYANAQVAYVGAGFEKGPHNVLEPLVFKAHTICGPNIKKFPMARYLKDQKLLNVIAHPNQFEGLVHQVFSEDKHVFEDKIDAFFENNRLNLSALGNHISPLRG